MNKAEVFDKARRLAYKGDFSMFENYTTLIVSTLITEWDWKSIWICRVH